MARHKASRALRNSTQITQKSESYIRDLNYDELDRLIRRAITTSYSRLKAIDTHKHTREDPSAYDYNKNFKAMIGKTRDEALAKYFSDMSGLSGIELREAMIDKALYLRTHLSSELSSYKGIEELQKKRLRGLTDAMGIKGKIERLDRRGKHGFRIGGRFYTDDQLTDFWKKFHDAVQRNLTETGSTNELLEDIIAKYGIKNVSPDDLDKIMTSKQQESVSAKSDVDAAAVYGSTSKGVGFFNE